MNLEINLWFSIMNNSTPSNLEITFHSDFSTDPSMIIQSKLLSSLKDSLLSKTIVFSPVNSPAWKFSTFFLAISRKRESYSIVNTLAEVTLCKKAEIVPIPVPNSSIDFGGAMIAWQ